MQYDIVSRPNYSALQCTLDAGEEIHAESGAMLAMDAHASIDASIRGGLWKAVKRSVLTSESFFVTTVKAAQAGTEVLLAPRATGDIEALDLAGCSFIIQGGSFLACERGIETDAKFSGWKGFLSGEGIFMIKAWGAGKVFVSSFGGILRKELEQGERFIVDNGHIVAFPADMRYDIGTAGSGLVSMVTTGEGLVCTFTGPGTILLQTRNLRTFTQSLNPFLRAPARGQGKGILGNIFGG